MKTSSTSKPGKPPGPPEKLRSARVPVQLRPDEYDHLARIAQERNVAMAEILREDARAAGHLPPAE